MNLRSVIPIKHGGAGGDVVVDPTTRARELYNRELKKGVELGRKLGAFERRYGNLRVHVTDLVNRAVLMAGLSPTDPVVLEFRNMVRIMKGKNKHEYRDKL